MTGANRASWLARWARRKAAVRKASAPAVAAPAAPAADRPPTERVENPPPAGDAPMAQIAPPAARPATEFRTGDLPPVESLGYESDFSPYLRPGVPEALRQQALRKLWRTNPVLANLDGLNDYDEDYSAVGMIEEAVDTLFRIGRGMADSGVASDTAPPEASATSGPSTSASGTKAVSAAPEATSSAGDGAPADGAPPAKNT